MFKFTAEVKKQNEPEIEKLKSKYPLYIKDETSTDANVVKLNTLYGETIVFKAGEQKGLNSNNTAQIADIDALNKNYEKFENIASYPMLAGYKNLFKAGQPKEVSSESMKNTLKK
jgi:hypothetical protein